MPLTVGVVLSAATALFFAWGLAQHQRPRPARWTRYEALSAGFTILLVAMLPASAAGLIQAALEPAATLASLTLWDVVAMVAAVALAVRYTPRFMRQVQTVGTAQVVQHPGAPTPAKPTKRAA